MNVISEQFPYRFCQSAKGDRGWIEKYQDKTSKYTHMYECDSLLQFLTTIEDQDYTRWLDPDDVPCYRENRGDVVKSPYKR